MSKLEALKTVLEIQEADKETVNDLILNYYNEPNAICFETLDGNYYVYNLNELEDEIYTIAEERYDELESELKNLIRMRGNSFDLTTLIDHINRDRVIDDIKDDLDNMVLEEYNKIFVIEEDEYFIYKEI